jgi:CDP-paratose 2-epimerase
MKALIFGGAGFIGCNIGKRLLEEGNEVWIFDNLSRKGTASNLRWLQKLGPISFIKGDIRNFHEVLDVFMTHPDFDVVYHMAGQVAVTTSVSNPREDFESNVLGSFNVLEGIRLSQAEPVLMFASSNKVYGGMEDIRVIEKNGRYEYRDLPEGVSEDRFLDFHSPYGCSKGAADQYVRDYTRMYGLKAIIFRQSCIYGYRQFGVEDQGWVAWFTIRAVFNRPITLYGNGKQVRDMLFIDDLINAYQAAIHQIDITKGKIYNIGGGPSNTMSLLELINYLEEISGRKIEVRYDDWRPGDQQVFVSNTKKAHEEFGWNPLVDPKEGVFKLYRWVSENRPLILEEGRV